MKEKLESLENKVVRATMLTKHGHFAVVGQLWKATLDSDRLGQRWGVHDTGRAFNWAFFYTENVKRIEDYDEEKFGFAATISVKGGEGYE